MYRGFGWLFVLIMLVATTVTAQEESKKKPPPGRQPREPAARTHDMGKTKKPQKEVIAFTPAREAAAMAFVKRHHAELANLLATLKKTKPAEYQRAVGALFRASEHLAQTQERNPERYPRELEAWKLKSRIQLLVAQLRIKPEDEKLRRDLKRALITQADLRTAQLVEERKRLAERLEKVDGMIRQNQQQRDSRIEKQIELLVRSKTKRGAINRKPREKPSPAPKVPPTQPARQ